MKTTTEETRQFALKPDAQAFDEIRIKIVPRFKESELSGDGWRISCQFEFYRNGDIILTDHCGGDMQVAAGLLFQIPMHPIY